MGCHLDADFNIQPGLSREETAILTVKSTRLKGCTHMIMWTGNEVLDPQEVEPTKLDDYEITEWWPLLRFIQEGEHDDN